MTTRIASATGTNIVTIPNGPQDTYLRWLGIVYTSSATVGNRQIVIQILDSNSNVIYQGSAGAVQAASLPRRYNFIPAGGHDTTPVNSEFHIPIPVFCLVPAGGSIVVKDFVAISGADTISLSYASETVGN